MSLTVQRIQKEARLAVGLKPGEKTKIALGNSGIVIGDGSIVVIAGPCAVEDRVQLLETAAAVKEAGSDGLMIEVHVAPERALSDGEQSLNPKEFFILMHELRQVAAALGRRVVHLEGSEISEKLLA